MLIYIFRFIDIQWGFFVNVNQNVNILEDEKRNLLLLRVQALIRSCALLFPMYCHLSNAAVTIKQERGQSPVPSLRCQAKIIK